MLVRIDDEKIDVIRLDQAKPNRIKSASIYQVKDYINQTKSFLDS